MVYLMRHGQDDESRIGGWSDATLTSVGIKQVKDAVEVLKKLNLKQIVSSDVKRAEQTTQIINESLNLPTTFSPKFRELDKGLLTGMDANKAMELYPEYFEGLTTVDRYPEGEAMIDLYNRVNSLLDDIDALEDTLIVTHRGVINMLYFILNDKPLDMNKKQFGVEPASIHEAKVKQKVIRRIY